jgi:hypothetical protein
LTRPKNKKTKITIEDANGKKHVIKHEHVDEKAFLMSINPKARPTKRIIKFYQSLNDNNNTSTNNDRISDVIHDNDIQRI